MFWPIFGYGRNCEIVITTRNIETSNIPGADQTIPLARRPEYGQLVIPKNREEIARR